MKKRITWFGIVAAMVIGISTCFIGCEDEINDVVRYVGKVVHAGTTDPYKKLEVKITNGEKIHCINHTDDEGQFVLSVKVSDIDGSYYALVGDSSCITKRLELSGYGQAEVDLGTIAIEGPSLPVVTTKPVSNVSDCKATCGGNVTADGRSSVTARGVCWSKSELPTIDDEHTVNGSGLGEFTSQITDLEPGMIFYVRAYATNAIGTAYGEALTLTTITGLPTVTTSAVSNISATTATCGGNVADGSGYSITERGVCWSSTTATPTINDPHTSEIGSTGSFTSTIIGLERNTTYYVRAYATNQKGTSYGTTKEFTTLTGLPTVTTSDVTEIKASSAMAGGDVTNNGGYVITARGICWSSTSSSPSITDDHTNEIADIGAFTSLMTGLNPSTTYYMRAYATNEVGTNYGTVVSFTTTSGLPSVETTTVSEVKTTTAKCGGIIKSTGGYTITAYGICWSSNSSTPTLSDSYTSEIINGNSFNSQMTNLTVSTTYYVRAYATNEFGTVYGETQTFTTGDGKPTVTTTMVSMSGGVLMSGGNVTDDGGSPITARGVCYGQYPHPDLSTTYQHTNNGTGTGYFTSTIGSFTGYIYVRAYATNANGTSYGQEYTANASYLLLPTFEYNGVTYKVAPDPGVAMTWSNANTYCNGLELYGYSDWYLPTKDELYQMYVLKSSIGGFTSSSKYWSSSYRTSYSSKYYYFVNFSTGEVDDTYNYSSTTTFRVRPIRKHSN